MITLTLNLPKKVEQELEKDLKHLETITNKPRDFHVKEALVVWKDIAEKGLVEIDKKIAQKIVDKVENYLAQEPYNRGEPLTGQYKGYYRFSDYRVIYEVKEKELVILVVKVGHRKEVYY
ncbi:13943_t:CDS:2 [Entrophospora sp. SA101]|nr:13943_t:CDS:2 [Entrophospora sp. SA101]